LGGTISSVYSGDTQIWPSNKIIDLGTAQTFNVGTILSNQGITNIDTTTLTADNFFFSSMTTKSRNHRVGWSSGTSNDRASCKLSLEKSYKTTTGVLTFRGVTTFVGYFNDWGTQYCNIHAYLVTDISKLTSLGTAKSFDISNYSTNINNYLFSTFSACTGTTETQGATTQGNHTAYYKFIVSISNNTLSAYSKVDSDGADATGNATTYYSKKSTV
jgi:hypothetical protein